MLPCTVARPRRHAPRVARQENSTAAADLSLSAVPRFGLARSDFLRSPTGDAVCCGDAAQALERARLPPSALLSPYVMNELNGDDRVSRLRAA